eukprot:Gb_03991 [translate_table: standard]
MLNNRAKLITKIDPLKYFLSKSTLIGRMAKCVMLLSEFDIEYVNQKSIKGQVLVDHLTEAPLSENQPLIIGFPNELVLLLDKSPEWKFYFDGFFTTCGLGAGIFLLMPQGDLIPKVFKIEFPCTNNIVECKALTSGLKLAIQWNIQHLSIFGDSQLVIKNQRKTFTQCASCFTLLGGTLYHRDYDGTLLRCLDLEEANLVVKEVH